MKHATIFYRSEFAPDDEVVPGVKFGRPEWVPSPAFWAERALQEGPFAENYVSPTGTPLVEDVVFCLLGGYGVKMEINRAAWNRLKRADVLAPQSSPSAEEIELLLRKPLSVAGRQVRYRFPRQRAARVAAAIAFLGSRTFSTEAPLELRSELMSLPGVGPKTASWIVRNWTGSNEVAILDIHVLRAGQIIGLFPTQVTLPRDYQSLEMRFLEFASALQVPASLLDALMWREMRTLTR
ncbi:hypothetical protein [Parvibaculum lavamentivorans]|nr:hypothetical protein [Parvibaculum lavamentivorans]